MRTRVYIHKEEPGWGVGVRMWSAHDKRECVHALVHAYNRRQARFIKGRLDRCMAEVAAEAGEAGYAAGLASARRERRR